MLNVLHSIRCKLAGEWKYIYIKLPAEHPFRKVYWLILLVNRVTSGWTVGQNCDIYHFIIRKKILYFSKPTQCAIHILQSRKSYGRKPAYLGLTANNIETISCFFKYQTMILVAKMIVKSKVWPRVSIKCNTCQTARQDDLIVGAVGLVSLHSHIASILQICTYCMYIHISATQTKPIIWTQHISIKYVLLIGQSLQAVTMNTIWEYFSLPKKGFAVVIPPAVAFGQCNNIMFLL